MGTGAEGIDPMNMTRTGRIVNSKQLCINVLKALEQAVASSNSLLQGDDLELMEATSPEAKRSGHDAAKRVLAAITAISSRYAVIASSSDTDSDQSGSETSLINRDIVFDRVRETTDEALEQFNSSLDSVRGIKDAVAVQSGAIGPECRFAALTGKTPKRQCAFIEMEKPQNHFPDYPIDNSDTAFVSPYGDKPAANGDGTGDQRERGGGAEVDLYLQNLFKTNSKPNVRGAVGRKHPYEDEIKAAAFEMSQKEFKKEDTCVYGSMESTPCTFVVTEEELFNMAERLKHMTELAVDIENHSVRSFQGFTCLIQISTRREDFVVDALALRGSIHRALAPVFTDDSIVKVLHGADKDVQWLERDFGIYVVNMFDTGQAARLLKFPSAALSFLQARFCDITGTSKKKFQLSDWRQRPLPEDMYQYARSDTHYLLYIYDRLRTELSEKELTSKAWERSVAVSQKRHNKIRYDSGMPRHVCAKYGLGFDPHQIRLLEELYRWRDRRAREEDESLNYVAPLGTIFSIVRARDKARTVEGLLSHGFPSKAVPPLIKATADEVVRLISDSLDAKLNDVTKKVVATPAGPAEKRTDADTGHGNSTLHCTSGTMQQTRLQKTASMNSKENARVERQRVSIKAPARFKSSLFNEYSSDSDNDEPDRLDTSRNEEEEMSLGMDKGNSRKKVQTTAKSLGERTLNPTPPMSHRLDTDGPETQNLKRPQAVEVPEMRPKVTAAGKSVFDLSDSVNRNREDENELVGSSAPEQFVREKPPRAENSNTTEMAPNKAQSSAAASTHGIMPKVTAARSSVFDLSDEDSCDEEHGKPSAGRSSADSTQEILARVRSGMCEFMPRASVEFRVETDQITDDKRAPELTENIDCSSRSKKRNRDDDKEAGALMSLEQRFGLTSSPKKKQQKKKRKKERAAAVDAAPVMPAFDYGKSLREDKKRRNESKSHKPFDAMQKLRLDWKDKGNAKKRPRKARKSPGSGVRSMSFKAT